jgi:hypothetical protein
MFWRIRQAGLRAAVTLGVVVHHHGSQTVRQERSRAPGFEAANKCYFDRKWRGERFRAEGLEAPARGPPPPVAAPRRAVLLRQGR